MSTSNVFHSCFLEPWSKCCVLFLSKLAFLTPYICIILVCRRDQTTCHEKPLTLRILPDCFLLASFYWSSVPVFPITGVMSKGLMRFEVNVFSKNTVGDPRGYFSWCLPVTQIPMPPFNLRQASQPLDLCLPSLPISHCPYTGSEASHGALHACVCYALFSACLSPVGLVHSSEHSCMALVCGRDLELASDQRNTAQVKAGHWPD